MGGEQQKEGKEGMKQRQRWKNWDKSLLREKRLWSLLSSWRAERGGLGRGGGGGGGGGGGYDEEERSARSVQLNLLPRLAHTQGNISR